MKRLSMNPMPLVPTIVIIAVFRACVLLAMFVPLKAQAQDVNFNSNQVALPVAVRTATTASVDFLNLGWRGGHIIMNVTAVPGADSITLSIQGKDPISGNYYAILTGLGETTTGTKVYKVYPAIGAVANAAANDILPEIWRINVVHSAGTSFTYSVSYFYEK